MIFQSVVFLGALLAQNLFAGLPIDGIPCQTSEGAAEHVHVALQLFDRGRPVAVPAGIGIPLGGSCLYWLHTHAANGIIHIESPVSRGFSLGQFFDIWGVPLSRTRASALRAPRGSALRVIANGKAWTRDPRLVPLRDHETIVIEAGPPFAAPRRVDWSRL